MEWDNNATIGYTSNQDPFDNHDPSSREVACVNRPDSDWSNVLYQLSKASPPGKEDVRVHCINLNMLGCVVLDSVIMIHYFTSRILD